MKTKGEKNLLIDFGLQPISNRYVQQSDEPENLFPLILGQCQNTGLIQLLNPVHQQELVPRYDWVAYSEPEDHLDELVDKLHRSLAKNKNPVIGGTSSKDDSTLNRFEKLGCKTYGIDAARDLNLGDNTGVESVQATLNRDNATLIAERNGKADLLVARHIWEHVYDQRRFAEALKTITAKDGFILFEVPDCTNLIDNLDHTMPWEEHLYYYTPITFQQSLKSHGFEIIDLEVFPYPYENSIVALVRAKIPEYGDGKLDEIELDELLNKGNNFAKGFMPQKQAIGDILRKKEIEGKIILFGAGHSAGAFINHYSLKDFVECVVDDDKNKQGLFMPKSRIPIQDSRILEKIGLRMCLLAVHPRHDEQIISKHKKFLKGGGEFGSICPLSRFSVYEKTSSRCP